MVKKERDEGSIRLELASELKNVGPVIAELRDFLKDQGVGDDSNVVLVTRELVNNAIEHGNMNDPEKKVNMLASFVGEGRLLLEVEDQGQGFDHRTLNLSMPDDPTQFRSRGLALVNAFTDEIFFNEAGNKVSAYVSAKEETHFLVQDDQEWVVITPTGDITAEYAENLRSILLNQIQEKRDHFRFDLGKVEDIDSISLSILIVFANMARKYSPSAKLVVVNAGKDIANLFEMTRLNTIFSIQ